MPADRCMPADWMGYATDRRTEQGAEASKVGLTTRELFTGLPMITAMSFFIQMLSTTVLNTALPAIAAALHRSPFSVHMAVVSYALTVALLIPVSGWAADRFGTRRTFLFAVLMFVLGSACCAGSRDLPQLVASRVLQGVGGAMMTPVSRLALLRAYRRDEFVQVFTFITIPGLVGPVLGPVVGGWIVAHAPWQWIFLINIPLGIAGLAAALKLFPDFRQERGPFDLKGFLLISGALLCITCGLEFSGGQSSFLAAAALYACGLALMPAYVWHARRCREPLIRLRVFAVRTFAIGISGNMVARLGIGAIPFLVPMLLQVGLGYSPDKAGLVLMASAAGALLTKAVVLHVLHRLGYRRTLLFLTLAIAATLGIMGMIDASWSAWSIAGFLFAQGVLKSAQFTSMNTITLGDLKEDTASDGNSLLSVAQNLSISFGVAVSTVLLRLFSGMGSELSALHCTCVAVGAMTALAAFVFMLLRAEDGAHLLSSSKKS